MVQRVGGTGGGPRRPGRHRAPDRGAGDCVRRPDRPTRRHRRGQRWIRLACWPRPSVTRCPRTSSLWAHPPRGSRRYAARGSPRGPTTSRAARGEVPPPARDLTKEVLGRVLEDDLSLLVTANSAIEIAAALRLQREFRFDLVLDSAAEWFRPACWPRPSATRCPRTSSRWGTSSKGSRRCAARCSPRRPTTSRRTAMRGAADVPPPARDLTKEVPGRVLEGELSLWVTANSPTAMVAALRLQREFGFDLVLDGATESYLPLEGPGRRRVRARSPADEACAQRLVRDRRPARRGRHPVRHPNGFGATYPRRARSCGRPPSPPPTGSAARGRSTGPVLLGKDRTESFSRFQRPLRRTGLRAGPAVPDNPIAKEAPCSASTDRGSRSARHSWRAVSWPASWRHGLATRPRAGSRQHPPGHRRGAPEPERRRVADVAADARRLGLQPPRSDRPRRRRRAPAGRGAPAPVGSRARRWSATACCSCRTRATSSRRSTR